MHPPVKVLHRLSSTRQWQQHNHRSQTYLFDSEPSTAWSTEQWSATSDLLSPILAEKDFSKKPKQKKKLKFELNQYGIESEFPNKRKIKASVRDTGNDSMKNYIKSMCNHELLNKNEEIILAREIQILLKWEQQREELETHLLR